MHTHLHKTDVCITISPLQTYKHQDEMTIHVTPQLYLGIRVCISVVLFCVRVCMCVISIDTDLCDLMQINK